MARKKQTITQAELNALAEKAQDLAVELRDAIDMNLIMADLETLEAAMTINQLAKACSESVNALIARARHVNDTAELKAKFKSRAAE
jgi:hypothetical protein